MPISLDQLKAAAPLKTATIQVEGLESLGKITMREMSFAEQRKYAELGKENAVEGIAWVLSTCVDGLAGLTVDDLNDLNPTVTGKLTTEVFRLSGLLPEDNEALEGN